MRLLRAALRQIHTPLRASTRVLPRGRTWNRGYATSISAAELEFGQPVYETHPHLLKPGEVTPGITAQEYADRRAKLAFSLPEGGVAVLPSAEVKYRSGAVFYPFRQESNFLYLTGFSEPQSLAVIRKTGPSLGEYTFHLFCRPKDPIAEQWSGPWSGLRAAEDVFNADEAGDINALPALLPPLLRSATRIYTDAPLTDTTPSPTTLPSILRLLPTTPSTAPLSPLINQHRALKSPAEVTLMRHAGRVSGRAFTSAMRRPWPTETDLHAYLAHAFTHDGLSGEAYVAVVAGGPRGRMIHYTQNTARLQAGETVLVDAGGERGGYVTDITRVWPVDGRFTGPQRDLYKAVLAVQRKSVGLCTARSGLSLDEVHRATEEALQGELARLGFEFEGGGMMGRRGGDVMGMLFPHHVGHYVGLDVHDVPGYPRSVPLKAGHCVTIEPGVYVPDDERFPKHFRGLAVRIEDSVCVDEEEPLVLTPEAVKEVEDIEALR
ncbi:peptidase M24, structural domain-containing protein [Chaetomium tenue]|uniref:Peptidase M24, structural domain-containing protein n=1 Tax=Chaetomium tenue TaxID=1854479 RepID=A0ACB7PKJ9_9PEZI|nr:peptidase M24, structural domain-containing protein [Chaetomium globosum]